MSILAAAMLKAMVQHSENNSGGNIGGKNLLKDEQKVLERCAGVAVVKDGCVLLGYRTDGQGWALSGGKQEGTETLKDCAVRELQEEFGIKAVTITELGRAFSKVKVHGELTPINSMYYLCTEFDGEPTPNPAEFKELMWVDLDDVMNLSNLFPASQAGLGTYFSTIRHRANQGG